MIIHVAAVERWMDEELESAFENRWEAAKTHLTVVRKMA